jgi:hypothetical protein
MLILPGKVLARSPPALMGSSSFSSDRPKLARRSHVTPAMWLNPRPDQNRYAAANETLQAERGDLQDREPRTRGAEQGRKDADGPTFWIYSSSSFGPGPMVWMGFLDFISSKRSFKLTLLSGGRLKGVRWGEMRF